MVRLDFTSPSEDTDAGVLARRYRNALKRFFSRKLRDPTEAEDLVQEVLLRLTVKLRSGGSSSSPLKTGTSYIFLTARSVLMDKLRRDRVREHDAHCGLEEAVAMEVSSAECVYSAEERVERISRLMQDFSPRVHEVFIMHRVEGLAYSEIAKALGISVSTVEKHMIAALRFLMHQAAEAQ